jgi:DnaK suppressor protein
MRPITQLNNALSKQSNSSYLSAELLENCKHKLLEWQQDLLHQFTDKDNILHKAVQELDPLDIASRETDIQQQAARMDTNQWLIAEIEQALFRIEQGTYGYCELTGEPIGLARLKAWPIARRSISAQEQLESMK